MSASTSLTSSSGIGGSHRIDQAYVSMSAGSLPTAHSIAMVPRRTSVALTSTFQHFKRRRSCRYALAALARDRASCAPSMSPTERVETDAVIVVYQDRSWFGDPRLATFVMSVDGNRVGRVRLRSSVAFSVTPGQHLVRIGQWQYRSRSVVVNVKSGETVTLCADIPRDGHLIARILRGMVRPRSWLVLEPVPPPATGC
jgi:hypothetical protein